MPTYRALVVYQPKDGDLTELAELAGTGYAERVGDENWTLSTPTGGGGGDVTGPGASTDHAIVRWDGTSGTSAQNSGITIADGASGTLSGTNTGDQTITLTGDVTGSGTGSFAATIAADAVTYAKIQNVSATDKVLGRSSAGAGDVEEIACTAAGRSLLALADPNADRVVFWDDSAGAYAYLTAGTGLAISGTTLTTELVTYTATAGTVNKGTEAGGTTYTNTQVHDGTYHRITETTGADPLRVTYTFSSVVALTAVIFFGRYQGSTAHHVSVEIYNNDSTAWDTIGELSHSTTDAWHVWSVFDTAHYLSGGVVQVRFRHQENGTATHNLYVDYLAVQYGGVTGGGVTDAAGLTFTASVPGDWSGDTQPGHVDDALDQLAGRIETLEADPAIASGTYTPTLTLVEGLSVATASICQYLQIGSVVTLSGTVTLTPS